MSKLEIECYYEFCLVSIFREFKLMVRVCTSWNAQNPEVFFDINISIIIPLHRLKRNGTIMNVLLSNSSNISKRMLTNTKRSNISQTSIKMASFIGLELMRSMNYCYTYSKRDLICSVGTLFINKPNHIYLQLF